MCNPYAYSGLEGSNPGTVLILLVLVYQRNARMEARTTTAKTKKVTNMVSSYPLYVKINSPKDNEVGLTLERRNGDYVSYVGNSNLQSLLLQLNAMYVDIDMNAVGGGRNKFVALRNLGNNNLT